MGYRSDVAYVVVFDRETEPEIAHAEYLTFHGWVKQHTIETKENHTAASGIKPVLFGLSDVEMSADHFKWYPQNNMLAMQWDHVKWYDGYPEVEWHEQLLSRCLEFRTGGYRFVRIGEEYNDIDIREEGHNHTFEMWQYLDVHRSIHFSPPSETEDNQTKEAA